jgi:hypothetical protein
MDIIGAGLAGLIAAHAWPKAQVFEAAPGPGQMHNALLRFRTEKVAHLTGVEFKKVRVHKGIWFDGAFHAPNIHLANLYSQKVLGGRLGDRSIWNIDPVERFIAPPTFYEQLIDTVGQRIHWNRAISLIKCSAPNITISTAPLHITIGALLPTPSSPVKFNRKAIHVKRWRIPGADVFQTVYFPQDDTTLYRASITGDTLIAEYVEGKDSALVSDFAISAAFGFNLCIAQPLGEVEQKYGKIEPIPDAQRKEILFRLTHESNIYSLGRFATWRNILLDDVVDDISVIKRMLRGNSAYDNRRTAS